VVIAVDETPVGTFVELEGGEAGIAAVAERLGRSQRDYVLDSYRTLFLDWQQQTKGQVVGSDMVFEPV
jgi:hypothetical protein